MVQVGTMNNPRTGVPLTPTDCDDARTVKLRPLVVFVSACALACAATWFSASVVDAQSQGVGLTVEAPAATPGSSPAASPSSGSPSPSTGPVGSSAENNGTVVGGTTVTPGGGGSGRPLPRTGLDVLRLLAIGLGSITLGQVLLGWARRTGGSSTA
jgi:hypothetical protein